MKKIFKTAAVIAVFVLAMVSCTSTKAAILPAEPCFESDASGLADTIKSIGADMTGNVSVKVTGGNAGDADAFFAGIKEALRSLEESNPEVTITLNMALLEGLETIPDYALSDASNTSSEPSGRNNVQEIILPESVSFIGVSAFCGCKNLTRINIPAAVTQIKPGAFVNCDNLKTAEYGGTLAQWCSMHDDGQLNRFAAAISMTDLDNLLSLTKLEIPDGVETIGSSAFAYCKNLTEVIIPESVTDIGFSAFSSCENLTTIVLPSRLSSISTALFESCVSLKTIEIPESVSYIGRYAFCGCPIESITIPAGVEGLGDHVFRDCNLLTKVVFADPDAKWYFRHWNARDFDYAHPVNVSDPSRNAARLKDGSMSGYANGDLINAKYK